MKKLLLTLTAVVALAVASKALIVWAEDGYAPGAGPGGAMMADVTNEAMNEMNATGNEMNNEMNAMANEEVSVDDVMVAPSEEMAK